MATHLSADAAGHDRERSLDDGPALRLQRVSLRYGAVSALDAVSFDVDRGSILCLLGASGSGKSSALRLIAGLERPATGRITIDGRLVAGDGCHVEPERRRVGMVFQDFALFPHLTAAGNVSFGLRHRARAEVRRTVAALLDDVGLADRADRYPHMLSGGERQRVALARALAPEPEILLMDEPFSSLDWQLRDQVREQSLDLLRRIGTTTVLVTHDPTEAMRVADRIGVLSAGRLVQFGTPADIYQRPCSPHVASILGRVNAVAGTVENDSLQTPLGTFPAPAGAVAGPAIVCVRPEHVRLGAGSGPGVRATVAAVICAGEVTEMQLRIENLQLLARVADGAALTAGDDARVSIDPSRLLVFPQPRTSTCAVTR